MTNLVWSLSLAEGEILSQIFVDGFKIWNLELKAPNFIIQSLSIHTNVENNKYKNPFYDGYSFISYYLRWWTINLWITISWETKEDFMKNISSLRQELFKPNQWLFLKINWEQRKVMVNCVWNPLEFKNYNLNYLTTTIQFEFNDFFLDLKKWQDLFFWQTWNFVANISNLGNHKTELEIVFVFLSGTNLNWLTIQWEEQFFSVSVPFQEGDILKIDNKNKLVLKNNEPVDFDGELLFLDTWTSRFDFVFDGDVKCDVFVIYDIKYE